MSSVSTWDVVAASASGFPDERHVGILGEAIQTLSKKNFPSLPFNQWLVAMSDHDHVFIQNALARIQRPGEPYVTPPRINKPPHGTEKPGTDERGRG